MGNKQCQPDQNKSKKNVMVHFFVHWLKIQVSDHFKYRDSFWGSNRLQWLEITLMLIKSIQYGLLSVVKDTYNQITDLKVIKCYKMLRIQPPVIYFTITNCLLSTLCAESHNIFAPPLPFCLHIKDINSISHSISLKRNL